MYLTSGVSATNRVRTTTTTQQHRHHVLVVAVAGEGRVSNREDEPVMTSIVNVRYILANRKPHARQTRAHLEQFHARGRAMRGRARTSPRRLQPVVAVFYRYSNFPTDRMLLRSERNTPSILVLLHNTSARRTPWASASLISVFVK